MNAPQADGVEDDVEREHHNGERDDRKLEDDEHHVVVDQVVVRDLDLHGQVARHVLRVVLPQLCGALPPVHQRPVPGLGGLDLVLVEVLPAELLVALVVLPGPITARKGC